MFGESLVCLEGPGFRHVPCFFGISKLIQKLDDPSVPPIATRISLAKLFLELELYAPALLVLHGVMSSDDQEVEAWYLEGWCYFLMAEQARETGGKLEDMAWEELARDARDRLETCQLVTFSFYHVPILPYHHFSSM